MPEERNSNEGFKTTTILLIVGIVLAIIIGILFFVGYNGILKFIFITLQILFVCGILFLLAYLFYHLFLKKQKFDVNYVNKQKLIKAGTLVKRPLLKDLYLSGDDGHSRALVGAISGYVRIQLVTRNYIYRDKIDEKTGLTVKELVTIPDDKGEQVPQYTLEKQEQDVFIVKQKGLASLFSDPLVIRVNPEDHDDLVGDVTLNGFSLIPISEYWFLNSDHLDVRKIDYAILKEAQRTIAFVTMTDMKELVDKATGVDARHKKGIEQKSLVELPETRNVNQQGVYS